VTGPPPGTSLKLVEQHHEPLLVHYPGSGATKRWLVMVHAIGENRTGNNYWQVCIANILAAADVTTVRFDLSGCGESLNNKDIGFWREQIRAAVDTACQHGAEVVHVSARGLTAGLLGEVSTTGHRIALFPTPTDRLTGWESALAIERSTDRVVASARPDGFEREFWEACGAESNLIGGFEIPRTVFSELIKLAADTDGPHWDLTIAARSQHGGDHIVGGHDLSMRLESDRRGLGATLAAYLGAIDASAPRSAG